MYVARRFPGWLRWLLAALVACLLLLMLAMLALEAGAWRALRAQERRIRASGSSVSIASFIPPPIPPQENAATFYMQAFPLIQHRPGRVAGRKYQPSTEPDDALFKRLGKLDGAHLAKSDASAISAMLQRRAQAVRFIEQGAARKQCAFPIREWQAPIPLIPQYFYLRQCARIITARQILRIHENQAREAVSDLLLLLRMGESLSREPTTISQLVRYRIDEMALRQAVKLLKSRQLALSDLGNLHAALARISIEQDFKRALEGDRAEYVRLFSMLLDDPDRTDRELGIKDYPMSWWYKSRLGKFLRIREEALYLDVMTQRVDMLSQPFRVAHQRYSYLFGRIMWSSMSWHPFLFRTQSMLFPEIEDGNPPSLDRDKLLAEKAVCEAVLAVRAYQARAGGMPHSLEDACAAMRWSVPKDPFSDAPLRYRPDQQGALVWSIGPDLKDDNAKPQDASNGSPTPAWLHPPKGDIVARVGLLRSPDL